MTLSQLTSALREVATASGRRKVATLLFNAIGGGGGGAVSSVFGRTGAVVAASGDYTPTQVGLGSVTNDAQTKAAVFPNTAPTPGQVPVGGLGAYVPRTVSGSGATITCSSLGVITISGITNASLANSAITIAGTSTALGASISLDTISGVAANGFLKRTGANTWTNDASTYLTAPVANASLANSSITLAGTVVALGGAVTLDTLLGLAANGLVKRTGANTYAVVAPGSAGNQVISDGTTLQSVAPASFQGAAASPTGTASLVGVMMGVAGTITPTFSGRIMVSVTGNVKNGTIADGASMHIRTGTGTKPVNGAALTGTAVGGAPQLVNTPSATFICPISDTAIVTGLAVGTPVWLDVDLLALTGGTATLQSVAISAMEF